MSRESQLTKLLKDYLQENFAGKRFSMYDIAIQGTTNKTIAGSLVCLARRSIVIKDGQILNKCGKHSPIYKLSDEGAVINKAAGKATAEYRRNIAEQAAFMNECGVRLHEVMDGITRKNTHYA